MAARQAAERARGAAAATVVVPQAKPGRLKGSGTRQMALAAAEAAAAAASSGHRAAAQAAPSGGTVCYPAAGP